MIRAVVFDLDGTLVQTERLKAISYARAVEELGPGAFSEAEVRAAFAEVVGRSREEVATAMLRRFGLEAAARKRLDELGVVEPWQAVAALHVHAYEAMLADDGLVRANAIPHNLALVERARGLGLRTALASMSHRRHVERVLGILDVADRFERVATREEVEFGKPDPAIDLLVARSLAVPPRECLVIEDSAAGVRAALAAGMACIASVSDLTAAAVRAAGVLDARWIVDAAADVTPAFDRMLAERSGD